jgi:Xaa-Pro aminopeptidase
MMSSQAAMLVCVVLLSGCPYLELARPGGTPAFGESPRRCPPLLDEREQWRVRLDTIRDRLQRLAIPALQSAELDAWLMVERDSQRDPMLESLGLDDSGDKAVLLVDGGGTQPRAFAFGSSWQLKASGLFEEVSPLTPEAMADTLARFRPRRIGINYSARVPVADGINTGTRQFAAWLVGREYAGAFRSAETAVIALRSTRAPAEVDLARQATLCVDDLVAEVLDDGFVPESTTAADLSWQLSRVMRRAGLKTSASPRVSVIRLDDRDHTAWPWLGANNDEVIRKGDLILIETEALYAGVATSRGVTAYVLRTWESEPPPEAESAFDALVRARNAVGPMFRPGLDGREVVAEGKQWVAGQGFAVELLSHAVGHWVRDVGTVAADTDHAAPYAMADVLTERPLQEGDLQALTLRVTFPLGDGRQLTVAATDVGKVGFGGLEFLAPPQDSLMLVPR